MMTAPIGWLFLVLTVVVWVVILAAMLVALYWVIRLAIRHEAARAERVQPPQE